MVPPPGRPPGEAATDQRKDCVETSSTAAVAAVELLGAEKDNGKATLVGAELQRERERERERGRRGLVSEDERDGVGPWRDPVPLRQFRLPTASERVREAAGVWSGSEEEE